MCIETIYINDGEFVRVHFWKDQKVVRWTASLDDDGSVYGEGATKKDAERDLRRHNLSAYALMVDGEDDDGDYAPVSLSRAHSYARL